MIIAVLFSLLPVTWADHDAAWSQAAIVRQGSAPVVQFQARLVGDYVFVRAMHAKGWHTYAMDNDLRAVAALKGMPSLGVEQGIKIEVENGLELDGRWLQSEPHDLSKPELRWYTYGFDQSATFACRVKKISSDHIELRIQGQACSSDTCCQIDVTVKLSATNGAGEPNESDVAAAKAMVDSLVPTMFQEGKAGESSTESLQ